MVTFEGYCRPLKEKVKFIVESVTSLDTKRGIKWSVKGNYQNHKIATFTNKAQAELILNQLNGGAEDLEVFGAEIAFQEAESFSAEEWDFGDDREVLRKGDEHSDFNNAWRWIFKTKRREWPNWGQKFYDKYKWTLDDSHWNPQLDAESFSGEERKELTAKHYKKDGSLDLRYKICREISATEKKNAESKTVEKVEKKTEKITKEDKKVIDEVEDVATEVAVDSVMDAESFDAETYNKVYRAEPNAIIFEENIPAEVWNIMGPDAQGHYLTTRDESVLIAPCCGVTKAELRIDNDANMDCSSCCYSGDDFHPRWWANEPKPEVRLNHSAEDRPMDLTYGNTATVPVDIYYKFMLELPPTVSATVTDDGFSMILGFHNQYASLIDALIEGYSPYEDAGNPQDTLYAEDTLSFVQGGNSANINFEAEGDRLHKHYSNTLNFTDKELDELGELYMAAESLPFNVEFEDWGKQEMKTHGKDVSFKEWLEEESKSHGNVPLMDWAEHEEESHDERYGAEERKLKKDSCCCGATKKNPCECMYQGISPCSSTCPCALENKMKEQSAETFEADSTSCFQCGRFGYDDEMMRIDYGYLCARCSNPDVDFSKIMGAEESPKISKKLIGLLGIGAIGALLAPKEIKKLFDRFKKS
tara:strand:- start:7603 stop:9537 length:1935 start_codon:yes stop_codon:yes gene_type:complete